MDREALNAALARCTTEVIITENPEAMKSRFNELHDLDMDVIFGFIEDIIHDSTEFVIQSEKLHQEIMENDDPEIQTMTAIKIMTTLSAERAFFAGYFFAEERFSNESVRS
jgi:hypothetical protein